MKQENNFFSNRIIPLFITLVAFVIASLSGCYCWNIAMPLIYRVSGILYFPFIPIFLSLLLKYPQRAYGGLMAFAAVYIFFLKIDCRSTGNAGGASMIQISIVYIGFVASIGGIMLFEIFRIVWVKLSNEKQK
jgi:hypothetical protein